MQDFILGSVVIFDALAGLVTWRGIGTLLFGFAVIFGSLVVGSAILASVVWLARAARFTLSNKDAGHE